MSSLRGKALHEAVEQVQRVVGPRAGLGVVLDGRARYVLQDQSFNRSVVQVELRKLGHAEVRVPADGLVGVDGSLAARTEHREAVVLGGDVDAAGLEVLDRVVGPSVAEGELEGLE